MQNQAKNDENVSERSVYHHPYSASRENSNKVKTVAEADLAIDKLLRLLWDNDGDCGYWR